MDSDLNWALEVFLDVYEEYKQNDELQNEELDDLMLDLSMECRSIFGSSDKEAFAFIQKSLANQDVGNCYESRLRSEGVYHAVEKMIAKNSSVSSKKTSESREKKSDSMASSSSSWFKASPSPKREESPLNVLQKSLTEISQHKGRKQNSTVNKSSVWVKGIPSPERKEVRSNFLQANKENSNNQLLASSSKTPSHKTPQS